MDLDFHGGLAFRLVLNSVRQPARADTVFRSLSFRDMLELGPQLRRLESDDSTSSGGVRVRNRGTGRGGPVRRERRP